VCVCVCGENDGKGGLADGCRRPRPCRPSVVFVYRALAMADLFEPRLDALLVKHAEAIHPGKQSGKRVRRTKSGTINSGLCRYQVTRSPLLKSRRQIWHSWSGTLSRSVCTNVVVVSARRVNPRDIATASSLYLVSPSRPPWGAPRAWCTVPRTCFATSSTPDEFQLCPSAPHGVSVDNMAKQCEKNARTYRSPCALPRCWRRFVFSLGV
jgi:hypothetical protein